MSRNAGGAAAPAKLQHNIEAKLEGDAVYLNVDDKYVYAACTDLKVRVWSRDDWELIAELGETSSPPLAVHVDDQQVFATCEKRVYVWNKNTWGMIGWFELSYSAITSTLRGDSLYVGAKEGRLVSIKKDSHETSSWQLFKSDISSLWGDGEIICTSTSKDEPVVWNLQSEGAPTELKRFDKKDKGAKVVGNSNYIISAVNSSEVKVWDRVEWTHIKTLQPINNNTIGSLWVNSLYLLASTNSSDVSIWDVRKGDAIGSFKIDGSKILHVRAHKEHILLATPDEVLAVSVTLGQQPLDLSAENGAIYGTRLLKTSPYDVLESVLDLQQKGDEKLQENEYHSAVAEYEKALQLLIDNTHALLEVPVERETLTNELNERLGQSLLRAKIADIQDMTKEILVISNEFEKDGRSSKDEAELEKVWAGATRAIKESRVLSEAQAGHILSYQLSNATDLLEKECVEAKELADAYKEKITEALTLTQNIRSEWRWLERKRSSLKEREEFLTDAISKLNDNIEQAEDDEEVVEILQNSLNEFTTLKEQIGRILSISTVDPQDIQLSKEDAVEAIKGLLSILEKRKEMLFKIEKDAEREREKKQLVQALEQALEAAESHKMKEEIDLLTTELDTLKGKESSKTEDKSDEKPDKSDKKKTKKKKSKSKDTAKSKGKKKKKSSSAKKKKKS